MEDKGIEELGLLLPPGSSQEVRKFFVPFQIDIFVFCRVKQMSRTSEQDTSVRFSELFISAYTYEHNKVKQKNRKKWFVLTCFFFRKLGL